MSYADLERRLGGGGIVILDGGTGTELERRGDAILLEAGYDGARSVEFCPLLDRTPANPYEPPPVDAWHVLPDSPMRSTLLYASTHPQRSRESMQSEPW